MTPSEIRAELAHYTGTVNWWRHPLNRNILYTDGVQRFAELCGAYWLLNILVTEPKILTQSQEFAAITVTAKDGEAVIDVTDGNENTAFSRPIAFTTLPDGEWKFYFYDKTIMLTSEY